MIGFGMTDRGNVRKENQDCFAMKMSGDGETIIAVVCDGMGGAKAGAVASQLAAETFIGELEAIESGTSDEKLNDILVSATRKTNQIVFTKALTSSEYSGMGTTLVGAIVRENQAHFINVGDSRAYHITGSNISRITRDHSLVEDMIIRGDLTPEEAKHHPNKNLITKAVGTEVDVAGDIFEINMSKGDFILLCSDGLTNLMSDQELLSEFSDRDSLEEISQALIDKALNRGAPDNVTVVLMGI